MGVSRDYTTGNKGGLDGAGQDWEARRFNTATLPRVGGGESQDRDHVAARMAARSTRGSLARPTREAPQIRPYRQLPGSRVGSSQRFTRVGSQQVVSVRGRRQIESRETRLFVKLSFYAIGLMIVGVCLTMWLSGVSTAQTFKIQQLSGQENTLDNQLETLHRDLENVRSSADVARRAAEASMGVPEQAGVVEVQENGDIAERRPALPESESIIDVNGAPVRPGQASSNPTDTADVAGNLSSVPQGQQVPAAAVNPQLPVQAPYAATSRP